eukprot:403337796
MKVYPRLRYFNHLRQFSNFQILPQETQFCNFKHYYLVNQQKSKFSTNKNKKKNSDEKQKTSQNQSPPQSENQQKKLYEPIEPIIFKKGEEKLLIFQSERPYFRLKQFYDLSLVMTIFSGLNAVYKIYMQQLLLSSLWSLSFFAFYAMRFVAYKALNLCIDEVYLTNDGKFLILITQKSNVYKIDIKNFKQISHDSNENFNKLSQKQQEVIIGFGRLVQITIIPNSNINTIRIFYHINKIKKYDDVVDAVINGKEIKVTKED